MCSPRAAASASREQRAAPTSSQPPSARPAASLTQRPAQRHARRPPASAASAATRRTRVDRVVEARRRDSRSSALLGADDTREAATTPSELQTPVARNDRISARHRGPPGAPVANRGVRWDSLTPRATPGRPTPSPWTLARTFRVPCALAKGLVGFQNCLLCSIARLEGLNEQTLRFAAMRMWLVEPCVACRPADRSATCVRTVCGAAGEAAGFAKPVGLVCSPRAARHISAVHSRCDCSVSL